MVVVDDDDPIRPPAFTDEALALEFTRRYGDELRYVAAWNRWLRWTGRVWMVDPTLEVFDLARGVCRDQAASCNEKRIRAAVASAKTVAAVERLARCDRQHAGVVEQWDADPWLLNTPSGQVDLRTGDLEDHEPNAFCSKMTTVSPGGEAPRWAAFLDRVTAGDRELQDYMRRAIGYGLTGLTREHVLFFLHGTGANGKSVLLGTAAGVAGDYHVTASMEVFTESRTDRHPTELANLRGARLVTATETEDGRRWAESRIKALTGGDRVAARFMRQDFFEFAPQFKLFIGGNHKPGLRSVDEAIRRRLHLIPFNITIPEAERDERLPEKLRAEWSGILAWAIRGAVEWASHGLQPPPIVRAATDEYLAAEDGLAIWLDERCDEERNAQETTADLFASWKRWAEQAGEYIGSKKRFTQNLASRGFEAARLGGGVRCFRGISLRKTSDADPWWGR